MQNEVNVRKGLAERLHGGRQHVAGLRMGGRDDQRAMIRARVLVGEALDVGRVEQHALGDARQLFTGFRQPQQPLALAHEEVDAEFVLEILDVLADAGLRGVEGIGDFGEIAIPPNGFPDDS